MVRHVMIKIRFFMLVCCVVNFGVYNAMAIEKAKYTVIEKDGKFELRKYEPYIVAETFVEGSFEEVGNEGFRRLYGYISGDNNKKDKIKMTAPVGQEKRPEKIAMTAPVGQEKSGDSWRITFLMPSEYTIETLPEPLDSRVELKTITERLIAVVKYSGKWNMEKYTDHELILNKWIEEQGLIITGEPIFARYDPPFKPWFLRKNEILIPVRKSQ